MSEHPYGHPVAVPPVFDEAGNDTSGQAKPERVLLSGGQTGLYVGEGFGLYVDPSVLTLNIEQVVEGEPDTEAKVPTDYEAYFATMVIRWVAPIIIRNWEDALPLSQEELETFYALPVYEDHQLPDPGEKGPDI
jgi:hypothetical protein